MSSRSGASRGDTLEVGEAAAQPHPRSDSDASAPMPDPPAADQRLKQRGRGRPAGYRPPNLLAGHSFEKRAQIAARLIEKVAADLPREEKLRRVGAMVLHRIPREMQPQEAVILVVIAVLEEEQRSAQDRIRQMETRQRARQRAELGKIARVSLALRRRPLACGGRHRRAPSASASRRRGSRRATGGGDRAGPGDGGDEPEPPAEGGSQTAPSHRRALRVLDAYLPRALTRRRWRRIARELEAERRELVA